MARSCALFLVGLALASFGAANAELEPENPIVGADVVVALASITTPITVKLNLDLSLLPMTVGAGTVTLVMALGLGQKKVVANLEAGKVSELVVTDVKLVNGVLAMRLQLLGLNKVILLDLVKLNATLLDKKLSVGVVLAIDDAEKVLRVQNEDGECFGDVDFGAFPIEGFRIRVN